MTFEELAARLKQFNEDYGIKKEADIRQFSDMLYALGFSAEITIREQESDHLRQPEKGSTDE